MGDISGVPFDEEPPTNVIPRDVSPSPLATLASGVGTISPSPPFIPDPSTWRRHSPPGSIMGIIRAHSHRRLHVDPLLWTALQPRLLRVFLAAPATVPHPPHRPTCAYCHACGKVPTNILETVRSFQRNVGIPSDRGATQVECLLQYSVESSALMLLIDQTVASLTDASGDALFKAPNFCKLPIHVGGKKQCSVRQAILVQDLTMGTPLLAFTRESDRCDEFTRHIAQSAAWRRAKEKLVVTPTTIPGIHPHDVGVLLAMAQRAHRIWSRTEVPDRRGIYFTPALITPTPTRDALYVYRATTSSKYIDSFIDMHKPFETGMHILQYSIPLGDPEILLETLCKILRIHDRLAPATPTETNGNGRHKRSLSFSDSDHSNKRQRNGDTPSNSDFTGMSMSSEDEWSLL